MEGFFVSPTIVFFLLKAGVSILHSFSPQLWLLLLFQQLKDIRWIQPFQYLCDSAAICFFDTDIIACWTSAGWMHTSFVKTQLASCISGLSATKTSWIPRITNFNLHNCGMILLKESDMLYSYQKKKKKKKEKNQICSQLDWFMN